MIIVSLRGGLGNQLFQYAAGRAVAERLKCELLLDLSWFEANPQRPYELWQFPIVARIATKQDVESVKPTRWSPRWFVDRTLDATRRREHRKVVRDKDWLFTKALSKINGSAYLDGAWQDERYFADIALLIRSEIVPTENFESRYKDILARMQEVESVAVHVRRTDFADSDAYYMLTHNYYEQAFKMVPCRVATPIKVFVFSDAPEWAKSNVSFPVETEYVEGNSSVCDLMLMARCKHHIIANSSFSWWGAWLGEHNEQVVIAPSPWMAEVMRGPLDIVPRRWTTLWRYL